MAAVNRPLRPRARVSWWCDASTVLRQARAMNRAYWETVAANYEREVLSVFDCDADGLVCSRIASAGAAAPVGHAADLGCGVGKFTPCLAQAFARVEACDLSARAVEETRTRCRSHHNVDVRRHDLAGAPLPFAPVAFVLCVNVLIMPALDVRRRAWRAVTNQVERGGELLLVVPALESAHFTCFRALEAFLDEGFSCAESIRRAAPGRDSAADLRQGVHRLDGLRTKHYLREELEWLLQTHEFDVTEVLKLEYRTGVAGRENPGAGSGPRPWDWLVTARRR